MLIFLTSVNHITETDSEYLDTCISKIADGDTEALSELYKRTSTSVYGFVFSVLKNVHDAEDVLQDCYIQIFNGAYQYSSRQKPLAWIFTIARNLCYQKIREQSRYSDVPDEEWESCLTYRDDISAEEKILVAECMKTLSDKERQIVILYAVSGFKHREIAKLLEIPLSTVLSKYHRAIKKLREQLQKESEYEK